MDFWIIDLTKRDGKKRLTEIKEAVNQGDTSRLLELVFIPLYGPPDDPFRKDLIIELLDYEVELVHQEILSKKLAAATMIMSNKIINKELLSKYWEKIQMFDIFEIAMEKGMEKGRQERSREMLLDALSETVGIIPSSMIDSINKISRPEVLSSLMRQAIRCRNVDQFQQSLELAMA